MAITMNELTIEDAISDFQISIYAPTGQLILEKTISNQSYFIVENKVSAGCYFAKISYEDYLGDVIDEVLKIYIK